MAILKTILFPIIEVMKFILEAGYGIFQSYGMAIIILSIVITIATLPVSKYAVKLQKAENALQKKLVPRVREAKSVYKGEEQFLAIEKIYKEFNYHPINSIRSVAGLALQIPFLLSALLLLLSYAPLDGASFGIIGDLGKPDALISLPATIPLVPSYINILPIIMVALSITESFVSPDITAESMPKANIVAGVLFLLVYALPVAVVFYWTCNNFWSLLRAAYARYSLRAA